MSTPEEIKTELDEIDPEILTADGLDAALIGFVELWVEAKVGASPKTVALYDREKCIQIFVAQGMTEDEASEHFEFNVIGGYVGKTTPAFATIRRVIRGEET